MFLWIMRHCGTPTNSLCFQRNSIENRDCKHCGMEETPEHVLRFCSKAKKVQELTLDLKVVDLGSISFIPWLDLNLKKKQVGCNGKTTRQTLFAATLWNLWKARNDFQFNNNIMDYNQIAIKSSNFAICIVKAFKTNLMNIPSCGIRLVKWTLPDVGTVKINYDGRSLGSPGLAGIGGLLMMT